MKLLFIFGTRPEAIKMAPLILNARRDSFFDVRVCVTGQHREMLRQVLDFFAIKPDHNLDIMSFNQSLFGLTAGILGALKDVLEGETPDLVLVQGDTSTAMAGALGAFYLGMPVAHIEAGLRSHDMYSPFPEEINRVLVGHIARLHFAPTARAAENLAREGIDQKNIHVVGNTVIDALLLALEKIKSRDEDFKGAFPWLDEDRRMILVTGHRRESFGEPFRDICLALREIAANHKLEMVYPVHLNPNVRDPVFDILKYCKNIHLTDPLSYPQLIWLMEKSYLVLTDSGGIQEEAPSLGKPVLVMREVTERVEGIEAGTCKLVGTSKQSIVAETERLLTGRAEYERMSKSANPYGDGNSSERILDIIRTLR